ncbi:MAG: SiaB family protein kinase [Acidobacteria bacterium]|nr:SiaB family protein kinase [Acidobacteriota bacterium]
MDGMNLFDQYTSMGREGVIFVFRGSMSQALLVKLGGMIREDLFIAPKKLSEIRGVFSVFVELAQNITRYSAEKISEPEGGGAGGSGIVVVSESEDRYTVASGNKIDNSRLALMVERLKAMSGLPTDGLRKLYREQLKQAPPDGSVGAGLGLYDMAKTSGGGLTYRVHPIDEETSFIELFVDIKKETEHGQA